MTDEILQVVSGPDQGATFPLTSGSAILGRDPTGADVVLTDPEVSRRHARVWLEGNRLWIEDLGSTAGTVVNGARIDAATPLAPGDSVRLGATTLIAGSATGAPGAAYVASESSDRPTRLLLGALGALAAVTLAVIGLAEWHPFQPSLEAAADESVAVGDPVAGETVWLRSCAGCHGADAGGGIGPGLRGNTLLTPGDIQAIIRIGRGGMPAGIVTGADEADVIAYLQQQVLGDAGSSAAPAPTPAPATTPAPPPTPAPAPAPAPIPPPAAPEQSAGDPVAGAAVFSQSCAACHGAQAEGGVGPALAGNIALTADLIRAVIRNGRGGMPAGVVSGQAEDDVIAYITQQVTGSAP